jgi:phosphomannomutase
LGIFKAYDIRGIVPRDLDADLAYRIGRAIPHVLGAKSIVVGRDMRVTGEEIAGAVLKGIADSGADAFDMGLCTTPMNYYATGAGGYGGGIMVTASHNPAEYNGIKMSRENAAPVSYETGIGEIEKLVKGELPAKSESPGKIEKVDHWPECKAHFLKFNEGIGPLKVAVDTGNGMSGKFLPEIFAELPCELVPLYFELDGTFPNHEANPLKRENMLDLMAKVKETGADIGVAFDGDGDRCMFVDERGEIVSSDLITALIARDVLPKHQGAVIIYDLRSSRVVAEEITAAGGVAVETRVGHSFMKGVMRERGAPFGGELSGHYYFREHYCSDCAELAMLSMLRLLSKSGKKLSELVQPLRRYHATGEINFEVEDKDSKIEELAAAFADGHESRLDGLTVRYADWWFNVRKSNTEPVLRLNLEADTAERRDEARERVEAILKR